MIQVPPGREFIGANDYIYNNIDSVAFNEGGRHGEGESWKKTMYGAFSGPLWVMGLYIIILKPVRTINRPSILLYVHLRTVLLIRINSAVFAVFFVIVLQ